MSAAENTSQNVSSQPNGQPLRTPPRRPSLMQPPPRPASQAASGEATVHEPEASEATESRLPEQATIVTQAGALPDSSPSEDAPKAAPASHPIAPPSEPMQYRAIGLIRGTYQPSEEQLNRGEILADDGSVVEAVLLGRVTSLIKKHIDLDASHLWVVYPRTRQAYEDNKEETSEAGLHLQIVGVWEPETLGMPGENPRGEEEGGEEEASEADIAAAVPSTETETPASEPPEVADATTASDAPGTDLDDSDSLSTSPESSELDVSEPAAEADTSAEAPSPSRLPSENYFSIRGEVLEYDDDNQAIMVKIVQGAKRDGKPPKAFRLHVAGKLAGKTVGYFWELDVERQNQQLILVDGRAIALVPPKKKKKRKKPSGPRKGGRRPSHGMSHKPQKPTSAKEKPRIRPSAPVKSNPL